MGGGTGGGGDAKGGNVSRYAPYVESAHITIVDLGASYLDTTVAANPYGGKSVTDPSDSFFGVGQGVATYTSMFELFNDFMTDVDLSTVYSAIEGEMVNSAILTENLTAETALINDELDAVSYPKMSAGLRDINAIMSTGYLHEKQLLENQKVRLMVNHATKLRSRALELAVRRYENTLQWNSTIVELYMKMYKFYWTMYYDQLEQSAEYDRKSALWPYTVFDQQRAIVSALGGGIPATGSSDGTKTQRAVAGALGGAAAGSAIGGQGTASGTSGTGAAIGAVLGGAAGYFS